MSSSGSRRSGEVKRSNVILIIILICLIVTALSLAGVGGWYHWFNQAAALSVNLQPVVLLEGENIQPEDFLTPVDISQGITAEFLNPGFTTSAGRHRVPMIFTQGKQTVEAVADLYVLAPVTEIQIEYKIPAPEFKAEDFIQRASTAAGTPFRVRFAEKPLLPEEYATGRHTLYLTLNGAAFEVTLVVLDNTPPIALMIDATIPMGDEVVPGSFIRDIFDESRIESVTFTEEPDVFSIGVQTVEIAVEDEYGNRGVFQANLTVLSNDIPPVIEGTRTIDAMHGTPIMYRQGVTAFDAFGRPLDFTVDSSDVNQNRIGMYSAVYRTEDIYGLVTEVEIVVHIVDIDTEWVDGRVDEVLAEILTDGMTQVEQAKAIFTWIRRNVSYMAMARAPQSAYEGAYRALRDRRGGCTIYSSISYVMLTRAEIPNLRIQRVPEAPTVHRWNLINPDGLGWYHFDTFPIRLGGIRDDMYMFTDEYAENFTRQMDAAGSVRMYFVYDKDLYPEVVQR